MSSASKAEPNFYDAKKDFWTNYRKARPVVPKSFWQRIYDYHASHGGSFGTVHDVGAGFGEMSLELSKRFTNVIVGDPSPANLNFARDLIDSSADKDASSRFTFRQERIEESDLPECSVDMIFSSTALHWMDHEQAVKVMTRQLKPGGTLFICGMGVPRYHNSRIQELWWSIMEKSHEGLVARDAAAKKVIDRADAVSICAYDCVALPERDFEPGAIRLKLNRLGETDAFRFSPWPGNEIHYESQAGPNDRLVEETERDWFFEVDMQGIRTKMDSYPLQPDPQMLEERLAQMEDELDGGKCEGRWPVTIILATKRKDR